MEKARPHRRQTWQVQAGRYPVGLPEIVLIMPTTPEKSPGIQSPGLQTRHNPVIGMSHHVRDKLVALGSALSFVLADWERALLQDLVSAEVIGQSRLQTVETMMLLERLEPHRKALDTLQTMPGINRATAASILVETGPDIYAPPSSKPPMPPQKTGNCQFAGFTRSIAARRGRKRALVATAHKMARILYVVLRDLAPYRDPDTDYEA